MAIGNLSQLSLTRSQPGGLGTPLTLGAVPIPTGIIADLLVTAVVTLGFVAAEDRCATLRDGLEHPALCRRRHRTIAGQVVRSILADHIGDFKRRAGHGWPSCAGASGKVSRGLGMMDSAWGVTWR
jgi:hypothetical protein